MEKKKHWLSFYCFEMRVHKYTFISHDFINSINRIYDDQIKADFAELYQALNGMPLREMEWIINPVCALCRDHERSGFIHGVQVGIRLEQEVQNTE